MLAVFIKLKCLLYIVVYIVFQFLHICEKLEQDAILIYSWFEHYMARILTEPGSVLVFSSVVKFFEYL